MKDRITLDMIIEKLFELKSGAYTNKNGVNIEINQNNNSSFLFMKKNIINTNKTEITLEGNYIHLSLNLDEQATLYYSKNFLTGNEKNYIIIKNNGYYLNEEEISISERANSTYHINPNFIFKEIDNTCWLGYDVETDKIYVYYRTNVDSKKMPTLINQSYYFYCFEYNDLFLSGLAHYNAKINQFLEEFKNTNTGEFKIMACNLKIQPLRKDFGLEIKELKKIVELYKYYYNKLNIEQNQSELKDVYDFIISLTINQIKVSSNDIQNIIENIDSIDKQLLINLRTELYNALESDKKTKKIRKTK